MEPLQSPYAIVHLVLPFLCMLMFGRYAPSRGFAWMMMAGVAMYEVILLCSALVLGHLEVLFPVYYGTTLLSVAAVLVPFAITSLPNMFRAVRAKRYRPQWVDIFIIASVGILLWTTWLEMKFDWSDGPLLFDSMAYHVPRAFIWSWQGHFHPWQTGIWNQIGNNVGGSATMLPITLMGRGFLGGSWTGVVCAYGSAAAVFVIARSFKLSVRSSLIAALCLISCPVIGLRFTDVSSDIGACFPVIAGVALFRTVTPLGRGIFYFIALSGVGCAIKQYVITPAFLLAIVMFLPYTKQILTSPRTLLQLVGGVVAAGVINLLSFLPVYEGFGTFSGGALALGHSSFHYGWAEAGRVTARVFVNWLLEPLSALHLLERRQFLTEGASEAIFNSMGIRSLYRDILGIDPWYPVFFPAVTRSGLIPLLLFPWLILSVKRGYRWLVTILFVALFVMQVTVFSTNYFAGRFMLVSLAAFALLWGARAEKNPILVSLIVLLEMIAVHQYVAPMRRDIIPYTQAKEPLRLVSSHLKEGEFFWLLSTGLTNDGHWGGKLGQFRFKYVVCPRDGDWHRMLTDLTTKSRWFILPIGGESYKPGPAYENLLGPICPTEKVVNLKQYLNEAGWRYLATVAGSYELWTTDPSV